MAELQTRLKPLIRKTQPFAKKIAHRAVWVDRAGRQRSWMGDHLAGSIDARSCFGKIAGPYRRCRQTSFARSGVF